MTLPYSKPSAYLNRFFRGDKRFIYTSDNSGNDVYENENWQLFWLDGEKFVLSRRILDFSVGADYYEEELEGTLIECVEYIKKDERKWRA